MNGESLTVKRSDSDNGLSTQWSDNAVVYVPNAHYGTIKAPILLKPVEETGIYKIIEDQRVVIIRNNERYDVTGKKL